MDCSKFNTNDFESKEWINDLIASIAPESLEKDLTDHVIKLQFYMQEVNIVVDENIQNVFQSLPRVMRDLDSIRQEAVVLQEQMSLVKLDIAKVEKSTQESMCSLLKFDSQKKRLSLIEKSLKEADSWSQICENIDEVMKSGDLQKIVDKITSLQHSLSLLTAVPDYEDRKKKVELLCHNFLSLLGPKMIEAFFKNDSFFIRTSFDFLESIGERSSGSQYYTAWFKPYAADMWKQCQENHDDKNSSEEFLLKTFYDMLLSFCFKEVSRHIFNDADVVIMTAVSETLIYLEPQFDKVVSNRYASISDIGVSLKFLGNCIKEVDLFTKELELILEDVSQGCSLQTDTMVSGVLSKVLYNQYKEVNDVFAADCKSYVLEKINFIKMDSPEISDCLDVLDQSVEDIISLAREAVQLCLETTHFTAVNFLLEIIKELFSLYIIEFKRVCLNITLKLSNPEISSNKLENTDNNIEDYYFLQDGIRLTGIGGHLSSKFEQFIQETLSQISVHIQELQCIKVKKRIFLRNYPELFVERKQSEIVDFWKLIYDTTSQINLLKFPIFSTLEETRQSIKFHLLRWLNKTVFECALEPVKKCLSDVPKSNIWQEELETGEVLPQFAYSPQEYITRIGQFFMTLPQQLEPFINENSRYYHESLLNGQLPHLSDTFINSWLKSEDGKNKPIQVAHVWLESIVYGSQSYLLCEWLAIPNLSVNGRQQLLADISYVVGLVEDLGLQVNDDVKTLFDTLSVSNKDELLEITSASNISSNIVDFVKKFNF